MDGVTVSLRLGVADRVPVAVITTLEVQESVCVLVGVSVLVTRLEIVAVEEAVLLAVGVNVVVNVGVREGVCTGVGLRVPVWVCTLVGVAV